jgi:hypothetical protein
VSESVSAIDTSKLDSMSFTSQFNEQLQLLIVVTISAENVVFSPSENKKSSLDLNPRFKPKLLAENLLLTGP